MAADVRVSAVRLLVQMLTHGGTLTSLLPDAQQKLPENERALLQAFCYGMARWSLRLSGLVDQLLSKPLKRKDLDVYLLLQLGIYQLDYMRIPSHAAVNTTVQAAANLGKPWARALVNAVLRNYQRRLSALDENLSLAQQVAHPQWLLTLLQQDWPGQWQQIVDQGNAHAPMSVRVNVGQISLDRYRQRLHEEGIEAFPNRFAPEALELKVPVPVQALPGFDAGEVSVQDTAAQLAAQLLNRASGGRLLDACAAPGGKTAHALEIGDWQHVEVLDIHAKRLQRVRESLTRLSLADRTALHVADAATVENGGMARRLTQYYWTLPAPVLASSVVIRISKCCDVLTMLLHW